MIRRALWLRQPFSLSCSLLVGALLLSGCVMTRQAVTMRAPIRSGYNICKAELSDTQKAELRAALASGQRLAFYSAGCHLDQRLASLIYSPLELGPGEPPPALLVAQLIPLQQRRDFDRLNLERPSGEGEILLYLLPAPEEE